MLLLAPAARADEPSCLQAYEKAQIHEQRGRLIAARRELQVCAAAACPALVRNDCSQWLHTVSAAIPTITLEVTDERAQPVSDWRAYHNGRLLRDARGARTLELDPGDYRLRIEAAGYVPSETQLTLHESEHSLISLRLLHARSDEATAARGTEPGAPAVNGGDSPAGEPDRLRLSTGAYLGVGAGVALGLGLFGYFALSGQSALLDLDDCKPYCEPARTRERMQDAKRDYTIANVGLAVAGASAVALAVLYFSDRSGAFALQIRSGGPSLQARF
jgi:hypothetical protein